VRIIHCDIHLNVMNSDCSLHVSECPLMVEEFIWMRSSNANGYIGLKVYCCQVPLHPMVNYDYFILCPCILGISHWGYSILCGCSQGIQIIKVSRAMTVNPSLKFSSMDLCCVFDDGQQGLEICVLHLFIILLYTNGFELLVTEG